MATNPSAKVSARLLTPANCAVILIDHEPQMGFATKSIDITELRNNVTGLAKAAKTFGVPTVLTTVDEATFSGPLFPELQAVFPDVRAIDRTSMNAWEDTEFVEAVQATGRKKLVIAALWTEVCLLLPTLCALDEGYEVYIVTDASGGVSAEAHERAITRMVQAGAQPVTWMQVLLEWHRDWARTDKFAEVARIAEEHGGAYGLGMFYALRMLPGFSSTSVDHSSPGVPRVTEALASEAATGGVSSN